MQTHTHAIAQGARSNFAISSHCARFDCSSKPRQTRYTQMKEFYKILSGEKRVHRTNESPQRSLRKFRGNNVNFSVNHERRERETSA